MSDYLSVEELIIDDSFINYCFQKNEADSFYWEQFVNDYPGERGKIEEAKQMVLGLHIMLKQEYAENKINKLTFGERDKTRTKIISFKKVFRYAAAVAAVFILVLIAREIINVSYKTTDKSSRQIAINKAPDSVLFYKTAYGEKKIITLSDNTKIWLNAGSQLRIDERYGQESREVYLTGEALFDVIHDELLPFIVHTDKYEVKDLGTVFNVKAYPDEEQSETALIEGEIEIQVKNSTKKIFLSTPNQKAVINISDENPVRENEKEIPVLVVEPTIKLLPVSYNQKDNVIIETAWAQNRLEIVNENFYEMKEKLERWFNVKISIKDSSAGQYPFTATFRNEDIQQVLQALQYAYHFNYTLKNNEINISK